MKKKNFKQYKFKNGATLLYKRRKICNATALCAGFVCGHLYSNEIPGLPHFFEHMLFKGTKNRTLEQITEDKKNITHLNAYTNFYHLCVNFYDSNAKIDECLEFASDLLLNSVFDDKHIQNELGVVFEEKARRINDSNKKIGHLHDFFIRPQLPNYDFIFGDENVLGKITAKDLENFRETHFKADKFIMAVSSSLSFSKIKKLAKKYFISQLKESEITSKIIEYEKEGITKKEAINVITDSSLKTISAIVSVKFPCKEYEYRNNYEYDFIAYKFRRDKDSFHEKVRENGLSYSCSANFYNLPACTNNAITFNIETSKLENFDKIIEILGESIKNLKSNGTTEEELKIMKDNILYHMDCNLPSSYRKTTDNMLQRFARRDDYNIKFTRNFVKKLLSKTNKETMQEYIDRILDKKNPIHITILSPYEEKDFKSIKEYKKMIFTK